ncbi:MurR/RpiR family transcriptional regulator [Clostridium sp.]|uniref:MurR/RpiR family transcriptional regulator n=1 Tax=Clostridium sp. TaxID=1506 RepID=UPI0026DD7408|nr:MurR/RpiR family transcriptional regulator [Clostridium sp.]MDO5039540.1 MurR/RpiR family transcriptional regulator [Clostridium sp.]
MGILSQLENPKFRATKSDKALIEYIKTDLDNFIYKSISVIASESNVGEATITRFTKKMGFSGFQDFKVTLAKELSVKKNTSAISSHVHKDEGVIETANKLLKSTIDILEGTTEKINSNTINLCKNLIMNSKRIYFVGIGYSGVVATDINYKFMRIGFNSTPITDSHTMVIMSSIMNSDDAIIAVSHSGVTKEIVKTVQQAKENGVKIITLTEDTDNPLRRLADYELTYVSGETILETGSISSKIPQIFLLDLVYTEVIKEMFNEAVERKVKTTNAIEVYNDSI